jgi:hypothetical protein
VNRNRRQVLAGLAAMLALTAGQARAAETPADIAAWRAVIDAQIRAFREGDADTAYAYAGTAFKAVFSTARLFFLALTRSRYALIAGSRSHRFEAYQSVPLDGIIQEVTLVGADQELRQALYFMKQEREGWRVQGVVVLTRGVSI